jgi:hypothetical protein
MEKGFSVVLGMSLAYTVSAFGALLAYIVYQRNHHPDELWRRRPVGISFFSALYGFILPMLFVANGFLTLIIKAAMGWDFNRFVWNDQALTWPILAGLVMFWLVGRLFWRMKMAGYTAAVALAAAVTVALSFLIARTEFGEASLHRLGAYISAFIWHLIWTVYLLRSGVRCLFARQEIRT